MADTLFAGFTTPSQPNTGFAVWDVDHIPTQIAFSDGPGDTPAETTPEQMALKATYQGPDAPVPTKLISLSMDANGNLSAVLNAPLDISGVTPINSSAKVAVGTLGVSNTPSQGTLIQGIARFLLRLSKLNRGPN